MLWTSSGSSASQIALSSCPVSSHLPSPDALVLARLTAHPPTRRTCADQTISFYDASTLALLTTLTQTRGAQTFATHTSVSLDPADSPASPSTSPTVGSVPTVTTTLLVGLKKRLLLFRWSDGSSVPSPDPLLLPHTPRSIAFVSPNRIVAAYTSAEQVIIGLDPMRSLGDVAKAETTTGSALGALGPGGDRPMSVASGLGGLGLGGMGGYMGLGPGKGKATAVRVGEEEVLVGRDSTYTFVGTLACRASKLTMIFLSADVGVLVASNGSFKRKQEIDWPLPPEETGESEHLAPG